MSAKYTFAGGKKGVDYVLEYIKDNALSSFNGIAQAAFSHLDPYEGPGPDRSLINYYIKVLKADNKVHSPRKGLWAYGPAEKSAQNSEGYPDSTASTALLNIACDNEEQQDSYSYSSDPHAREIWTVKTTKGSTAVALILSTDGEFANFLYCDRYSDKSDDWRLIPICGGEYHVLPDRIFCKSVKYFEEINQESTNAISDAEWDEVRYSVTHILGGIIYTKGNKVVEKVVEVPVEKVVTKEVPVEVEKIVEKTVEVPVTPAELDKQIAVLQAKVDIYERVMKAQGLLS